MGSICARQVARASGAASHSLGLLQNVCWTLKQRLNRSEYDQRQQHCDEVRAWQYEGELRSPSCLRFHQWRRDRGLCCQCVSLHVT